MRVFKNRPPKEVSDCALASLAWGFFGQKLKGNLTEVRQEDNGLWIGKNEEGHSLSANSEDFIQNSEN